MGKYDLYKNRVSSQGCNDRDRMIGQAKDITGRKLQGHPNLRDVKIEGEERQLVVISKDSTGSNNTDSKQIVSLPNETFSVGQYVEFVENNWIITKADLDSDLNTDGQMILCPYNLKFQDSVGEIISYPYHIISTSPTLDENNKLATSGSVRKIRIQPNEYTRQFFIDKRFMGEIFNGVPQCWKINELDTETERGILIITFEKSEYDPNKDSIEYGVCNYIFPTPESSTSNCEIKYSGKPELKVGGSAKSFQAVFYDSEDNVVTNISPVWNIDNLYNGKVQIKEQFADKIKISVSDDNGLIGNSFVLKLSDADGIYSTDLEVKMISLMG